MSEVLQTEVLVVGGGPAGLAAALTARDCGRRVVLVDDNPSLGGQIWRGQEEHPSDGHPLKGHDAHSAAGTRN